MLDLAAIPWRCSDLKSFLDLFASVTNIQHVEIGVDRAIRKNSLPECQVSTKYASTVAGIMHGSSKPFTCGPFPGFDHSKNFTLEYLETKLKQATAEWALKTLDNITSHGTCKMTKVQYNMFVMRWPYFETLPMYDEFQYKMRDHESHVASTLHARRHWKRIMTELSAMHTSLGVEEEDPSRKDSRADS